MLQTAADFMRLSDI